MTEPQIVQENGEKSNEQSPPERPKWGAIYRALLPSDTDGWQQVHVSRPKDDPRSRLGVQNRAVEW